MAQINFNPRELEARLFQFRSDPTRNRIIHRIEKIYLTLPYRYCFTSGCVEIVLGEAAERAIKKLHKFLKEYEAITYPDLFENS